MASPTEEKNLDISESLGRTEQYIEDNKRNISIVLGIAVLLAGGYLGYRKFVIDPREKEAQSQMFVAERYFEMDSLNLAIKGDGNYVGFEAIANDYGMTKSANLAQYYLGICLLKQGEFDKAIEHLKKFDTDDEMLKPVSTGAIGDAYMELGKTDEASTWYRKAAEGNKNDFTSPLYLMKAGLAFEKAGKFNEAVDSYEKIKNDYPKSAEAGNVDKYIARSKASSK